MHSPTTLTSLYGAILDDSLWQSALDEIAMEFGARSVQLIHSEVLDEIPFHVSLCSRLLAELPPEMLMQYESEFAHYEEEAWSHLQDSPAGTIAVDTDFASPAELRERPDTKFLIENFCMCHRIGLRLNGNQAWFDALTLIFPDSMQAVPDSSRILLKSIWPHVAKATECSRVFRSLRMRYQAALTALDHVLVGICVVNSRSEVIISNTTASEIISENSGLRHRANGVLQCDSENEIFNEAVRQCSMTAAGESATTEVLLVADEVAGGGGLLIEISQLHDKAGEVDRGLSGALITLIDPQKTDTLDCSKVAHAWQLTRAEAEVLRMLVLGDSYSDMADKRSVSIETIKTQVKSVYIKTNTKNRSNLIRLVAKTSPPIH